MSKMINHGQAQKMSGFVLFRRAAIAVILPVLGVILAPPLPAAAETIESSCKSDPDSCGKIRLYNEGAFIYSDIYLEGSRKALLTDDGRCNSIDYRVRKDLMIGGVHTFKVPAPCHYTLIVNVAGAIGKAATKTTKFSLGQGCEVKVRGTGTVDFSHLKNDAKDEETSCVDQ